MSKKRADLLLVERGLAESRERARALILAGRVYSGERRIDKAGTDLAEDLPLEVRGQLHDYVSRGGVKLEGALAAFAFDPTGKVAADFGASTGGFTECLLRHGAARVYAIDVGYGQLHQRLRNDPRVIVHERTNARNLTATTLPEVMDLVVIDASFIGLEKLLPAALAVLRPGGDLIALVKPQFEVGAKALGKKGVVRDEATRLAAIDRVAASTEALGFEVRGRADCVIRGPEGNQETFLYCRSSC